jgi:hypothetical protein
VTVLPNLFIVGAMKCGTSSLHFYLDQHPSISMSSDKEPSVFTDERWMEELVRYGELLDGSAPVRGESSTNYSKWPAFPNVPERIARVVPDARLIYIVGDPFSRTVAHYVQLVADGAEDRPLREALRNLEDQRNTYVWNSRYGTQIERYLEHFPAENLLVLDRHELLDERAATLRKVFRFLGVDEHFSSPRFQELLNTGHDKRRLGRIGVRLRASGAAEAYRRALPAGWRRRLSPGLRTVVSRPVERPALDAETFGRLAEIYEPEMRRLEELTGKRVKLDR